MIKKIVWIIVLAEALLFAGECIGYFSVVNQPKAPIEVKITLSWNIAATAPTPPFEITMVQQ